MPTIRIAGMFQASFRDTSDNKKFVSDSLRSLLKQRGVEPEGKIRFAKDGSVTLGFSDAEQADAVVADLRKLASVAVDIVGSQWELLIATRSAAIGSRQGQ